MLLPKNIAHVKYLGLLVSMVLLCCCAAFAQTPEEAFVPTKPKKPLRYCSSAKKWLDYAKQDSSLVEITYMRGIRLDLRYATFDNVTGHDMYCGIKRAFVHKDAMPKLKRALALLKKEMPGASFVIFDAARPLYAQSVLKSSVARTPYSNYVSSGKTGGLHNYGLALDMSIADENGYLLDMGTDFDSFESCAGEVGEAAALKKGRLTQRQIENRNVLRSIMKRAGWVPLGSEWWHFNAFTRGYTKENYPLFPL